MRKFEANLTKRGGEVSMDKSFGFMCSLLRNGEYIVSIKRKSKPRTLPQNALMWMWYACMEDSTGQRKEDIHDYYKAKFLSRVVRMGRNEYIVSGSTTTLDTEQMTEYLEKVKADAATEFGIILPLPEDREYQEFVNEYQRR